jgi:hypothetical protein
LRGGKKTWSLVGGAAAVLGLAVALILALKPSPSLEGGAPRNRPPRFTGTTAYAINKPHVSASDAVSISDRDKVLGVTVAGKHRAYCIGAMKGNPRVHVVNDLLAGTPVSVTYCDRLGCAKVFTGESSGTPLKMAFGGFEGQMVIRANDLYYYQGSLQPVEDDSKPFPFPELPFVYITWGEWKTAHPDTDVYVGVQSPDQISR